MSETDIYNGDFIMLLDFLKTPVVPFHLVNTGTILDIATGNFVQVPNQPWILEGGLSQIFGITGRGQTYKSNLAGSFLARAMEIHKDATAYIFETEGTISGAEFYDRFVDEPVSDRIAFRNNTIDDLTSFSANIQKIVDIKKQNKNDLMVDGPFIDPETGKPQKIWVPTFVLIDSYSRASCTKADNAIDDNDIDSSSLNTWYVVNGNAKTKFLSNLNRLGPTYGIYAILTAHVGDKINLDAKPTRKEMQYMAQNDKLKNVGSNFTFLTSCMMQTIRAGVRTNSSNGTEFPLNPDLKKNSKSSNVEVNEIETRIIRSKNNVSGLSISYLVSQYQGILDSVTNFEFLRTNDYYGLNVKGNKTSFSPKLLPDTNFTKTVLRKDSHDKYELKRALEILAQLSYVQNNWNLDSLPEYMTTPIDEVAELLSQCEKSLASRILNSTGVWSTSKMERERFTIIDILDLIMQSKKNKVSVAVPSKK